MYFSSFPTIEYRNLGANNETLRRFATDILRRVGLSEKTKDQLSVLENYIISEGERPEQVANTLYGNPEYHWIVLLFNDIVNPYYEWPLDNLSMEQYIQRKYPGKVLYISNEDSDGPSPHSFYPNETIFKVLGNGSLDYSVRGLVWRFNKQLCAIEVINKIDSDNFQRGDTICRVAGKNPDGTDRLEYAKVQRVITNTVGLHHFESTDENGDQNILSPFSSFENIPLGFTGSDGVIGFSGPGSNTVEPVDFSETRIGSFMAVGGGSFNEEESIRNDVHEYIENDRKRTIRVLNPQYISGFLRDFETLMRVQNQRTIYTRKTPTTTPRKDI